MAALTSPSVRRAASGALADLMSLPARLRDPERRAEPWAFRHNVGNGEFRAMGEQLLRNLTDHAGLTGWERVLDIGCGSGRAAIPMADLLAAGGGRYLGFDVSQAAIAYCRRRFAEAPHMAFVHLDVRNADYNPRGAIDELEARFPAEDASFDLAVATSVFTHMKMPTVRRYLAETARVLAPGGRLAFTAFATSPGRESTERFPFQPFDQTSSVLNPRVPEQAIAHRLEALDAAIQEAGLTRTAIHRGAWSPPAEYDGGQDLIVAVKPLSGTRPRG